MTLSSRHTPRFLAAGGADRDPVAQWNHGGVTLPGDVAHPTLLATLVDWVEKGAASSV